MRRYVTGRLLELDFECTVRNTGRSNFSFSKMIFFFFFTVKMNANMMMMVCMRIYYQKEKKKKKGRNYH